MNEIFEHLRFFRQMTNTVDPKVQISSFWGIIGTLLMYVMDGVKFLATDILGITVYFTIALFVIMITDYVTGLLASRKEHIARSSKKGLRWVFKFGCYILFVYTLNALTVDSYRTGITEIALAMELLKYYVVFHIASWELQSIDENFERLGYSFRIFKLFNNVHNLFMTVFNKKIGVK